jgi:hypothetical protein
VIGGGSRVGLGRRLRCVDSCRLWGSRLRATIVLCRVERHTRAATAHVCLLLASFFVCM